VTLLQATESMAVRSAFKRLADVAMRGLPRMLIDDGRLLCHRAIRSANGGLELEGRSERYTAMTVIGAKRWLQCGGESTLDLGPLYDGLAAWKNPTAGDLGLLLWAQILQQDSRAEDTAKALLLRPDEVFDDRSDFASMDMGFLLRGLAAGRDAGMPGMDAFADRVAGVLLKNQDASSGLFTFGRRVRRKNFFRTRRDTRLGSFASQVYPTMGLSALTLAGGDPAWLVAAERCAERIAELQGAQGQWWWIYHQNPAKSATRYPVYTVHQDAMGPMMLLSVALATNQPRRFDASIEKSLSWFDCRDESRDEQLIDGENGMIWRAVQRDAPQDTGQLGLSARELIRMDRVSWTGGADRRPFDQGYVCYECRPYHLGWVLLAAAMWEDALGNSA
jgi:hypothetical protein